jgi:hypothetical protein
MKINYKNFTKKIKERLKKADWHYRTFLDAYTKKNAADIIDIFSKGIQDDSFDLKRLKPETIKRKKKLGYSRPENPLAGLGGKDKRSYKNMMIFRKLKNGYRVEPSKRYHHSGKVKLSVLFRVHEYGCLIKRGNSVIKIPKRPALERAVERFKQKRGNIEVKKELKPCLVKFINLGKLDNFNRLIKRYEVSRVQGY